MPVADVTLQDVYAARKRIGPVVQRTALVSAPRLAEQVGTGVHLKLENLQETGSFKVRGAANKLLSLSAAERQRGVTAFSTGNHGLAVSHVAGQLGIGATICVSTRVPRHRTEAIERLGAEVAVRGESQDEAGEYALRLQREGMTLVKPFDDLLVIAGQGTIGLEMLEDLPEVDTVIVPLSGGGLISGVALALKTATPAIRVIGVSMERAPVMVHSLKAGVPVEMEEEETLADSLAGGIGLDNQYTFRMVQTYVDDVILVAEEEIAEGMAFALEQLHLVVEGAGAVGIAALLHGKARVGHNVVVLVSGGNVAPALLREVVQAGRDFGRGRTGSYGRRR